MTTAGIRARRGVLTFLGCSLLWIVGSAQLGDRARPGVTLAALEPTGPEPRPASRTANRAPRPTETVETRLDGAGLAALVTRPVLSDPTDPDAVPGVVLVPGSGPRTRNDLADVAVALAQSGVASIRHDKRTSGYSPWRRDFRRLADDVAAAARTLAAADGVDRRRVGALGVSEGGWVVPLAAQRHPDDLAFLVLVSAPIVTPAEQLAWAADRALASAPAVARRIPATVLGSGRSALGYTGTDIGPALRGLQIPVRAIWGADDPVVPVNEAVRRLQADVDTPLSVQILPGVGHHVPVGGGQLDSVADWILDGPGPDATTGVEPSSDLGVPVLPPTRWYRQAPLHLGSGLLLGLIVVFVRPGRASRRGVRPNRS